LRTVPVASRTGGAVTSSIESTEPRMGLSGWPRGRTSNSDQEAAIHHASSRRQYGRTDRRSCRQCGRRRQVVLRLRQIVRKSAPDRLLSQLMHSMILRSFANRGVRSSFATSMAIAMLIQHLPPDGSNNLTMAANPDSARRSRFADRST